MPHLKQKFKNFNVLSILTTLVLCVLISLPTQSFSQCNVSVFINEFHYDNAGGDVGEFVEVAVPLASVINLADYQVTLYNGGNGMEYNSETLNNFQVGATDPNFTYYVWQVSGIQNGAPDGIAITENSGLGGINNCDFVSYEGAFLATDGPAIGQTSMDVGVSESSSTPIGSSLQLINSVWMGPTPATPGMTNTVVAAPDVILISEISLCDQSVELENVGTTTVDISTWQLCNSPAYADISTMVFMGSLILAPGDFVTVKWNGIDPNFGEVGLYIPGGGAGFFGNSANIRDYVQYNNAPETRALVAVAAGVWDDANIAIVANSSPICMTSIADGPTPNLTNSTTWCTSQMNTIVPPGPNSACFVPSCGITALAAATFTCGTSTPGIDMVQVDVAYTGVDGTAVLSITTTSGSPTNFGDDPNVVTNGTISFNASEGEMYTVTFTDPLCSTLTESGTIPPSLCISCPSVGDLIITEIMYNPSALEPAGEWFEICNTTATAIDMIGMEIGDSGATDHAIANNLVVPPNGCVVISHTDVTVCGGASSDYQHGSFSLAQGGDDVEIKCSGLTLDIVSYDGGGGGGFPSESNGESISFDSSVPQTDTDNDIGANWCVGSIACGADDFATPGVANPVCAAVCGINFLANPVYTCQSNTGGVDAVKVDIAYGGVDPNAILSITVNGMPAINGGDDPQLIANGTISFQAMEGDPIIVTFTDPLCMNLMINTNVPPNQCPDPALCSTDFFINGIVDGDLPGGLPKAVQFCASAPIPDLSIFGIETVSNGTGANGIDWTFPADALGAGDCIWVSAELPNFIDFFGIEPCYVTGTVSVNGDDAIMLYCGGTIIDQLGDPNCDPNAPIIQPCGMWAYVDGWIIANDIVPNPIFDETEWTIAQGALMNAMTNAMALNPYPQPASNCPVGLSPCPDDYANGGMPNSAPPLTGLQDVDADYETDGEIVSIQIVGSVDPNIVVDYDSGISVLMRPGFEVYTGVTFHAFIDGCGGI